jgi:hypothetical protein
LTFPDRPANLPAMFSVTEILAAARRSWRLPNPEVVTL